MPAPRPESIINYSKLRARKAELGIYSQDLVQSTGKSWSTVSGFFNGCETLNLGTIKRLASELGLKVRVEFELIDEEQK